MTGMQCVTVQDLWFHVGGRTILQGLSMELRTGVNWIRGPNGAGKTTLLRLLAGAMRPSAGHIHYQGAALDQLPRAQRQRVVYCGDELPDLPWLKCSEWVSVYQSIYPNLNAQRLQQLFDTLQLGGIHSTPLAALSLGERKKLGLALAFAVDADVLLLDEPFNALDAHARDAVQQILQTRTRERSQILAVTSHIEPVAFDQVIALGPPAANRSDCQMLRF